MTHARTSSFGPRQLLDRSRAELCRQWLETPSFSPRGGGQLPDPRIEASLVEVELARKRLRDGRYGLCLQCSRSIDLERLIAHPAATRCWHCQQLSESPAAGH